MASRTKEGSSAWQRSLSAVQLIPLKTLLDYKDSWDGAGFAFARPSFQLRDWNVGKAQSLHSPGTSGQVGPHRSPLHPCGRTWILKQ